MAAAAQLTARPWQLQQRLQATPLPRRCQLRGPQASQPLPSAARFVPPGRRPQRIRAAELLALWLTHLARCRLAGPDGRGQRQAIPSDAEVQGPLRQLWRLRARIGC